MIRQDFRETEDRVEKEGVHRTWKVIRGSDIIVFVHDSTKKITNEELIYLNMIKNETPKEIIIANNKIDIQAERLPFTHIPENIFIIETSAMNNTGIEKLKNEVFNKVLDKSHTENGESAIITNERHYFALLKAKQSLISALDSLKTGESEEFIAIDLRASIDSIGEIVGLVTTEDILNNIFSKFCIGK